MAQPTVPAALAPQLELLSLTGEALTRRYDARLAKYFASYGNPATFLGHHVESFEDAAMQGARVLDFGCGFGVIASTFAALGAERVVGVDMDGSMIARGKQLLAEWVPAEVAARVELVHANILHTDFGGARFDVVTAIESLSHVQSVYDAIRAIRGVIAPRGRVLVSDGNNRFYPLGRRRRRRIWDAWERDVAAPVRRAALKAHLPELSAEDLERLVQATVGLSEPDAIAAARLNVETGRPPPSAPDRRMMHPRTGYHEERELDPFELIRRFEEFGFTGRLLLPHSDYPPNPLHYKFILKKGLRRMYPWTLPAFPGFRVLLEDTRSGAPG